MASTAHEILQLKVTLRQVRPPIWRRIQLESSRSLADLHKVLQIVMGWTDSHMHQFDVGGAYFANRSFDLGSDIGDAAKQSLHMIAEHYESFGYEYDFGDGWQHDIVVEKVLEPESNAVYPICTAGKRACPPEDCGGPWGYGDILKALKILRRLQRSSSSGSTRTSIPKHSISPPSTTS